VKRDGEVVYSLDRTLEIIDAEVLLAIDNAPTDPVAHRHIVAAVPWGSNSVTRSLARLRATGQVCSPRRTYWRLL